MTSGQAAVTVASEAWVGSNTAKYKSLYLTHVKISPNSCRQTIALRGKRIISLRTDQCQSEADD